MYPPMERPPRGNTVLYYFTVTTTITKQQNDIDCHVLLDPHERKMANRVLCISGKGKPPVGRSRSETSRSQAKHNCWFSGPRRRPWTSINWGTTIARLQNLRQKAVFIFSGQVRPHNGRNQIWGGRVTGQGVCHEKVYAPSVN